MNSVSTRSLFPICRCIPRQLPVHLTRRQTLQSLLFTSILLPKLSHSAEVNLENYSDPIRKISISYPPSWTSSVGSATEGDYVNDPLLVWHPAEVPANDVNVTLLVTNAGADFTRLGSFGTVEDFGNGLVNSMDRSYLKRGYQRLQDRSVEVQTASLLDASKVRDMYRVEYLLKKPKEDEKHFISLIALRFDGTYNKLYTLTGQCYEKEFSKFQHEIQVVLNSFQPPSSSMF